MIEIIKQGTLNRSIANCSHCGCQFYFDESDTQPTLGLTYAAARHVKCPCCYFEIPVNYPIKTVSKLTVEGNWEEENFSV